ncbi:MAG: putative inorganic carbon transporter subunit DabA, partial [Pseudomonadota bacterium]
MFINHAQIAPSVMSATLKAAETAARRIPPAFPLEATVAVNPFLGQTDEDLATASARLQRVAGVRAIQGAKRYAGMIKSGSLIAALSSGCV